MVTKEQINAFLSDSDYLSLIELEKEQRLLFITDISETRVSAFLAWLFRPYEGHGLGDQAFRELMLGAWRKVKSDEISVEVQTPKWLLERSFRDLLVETEYQVERASGKGPAVDLLLISRQNKLVIDIENKFGTKVHSSQLRTYRKGLAKLYPDYSRLHIYLDSNEENQPDDQEWVGLSYEWILKLIDSRKRSGLLSERALDALSQFREYLADQGAAIDELESARDALITSIATKHGSILQLFKEYRKTDWHGRLLDSTSTILEPLLIEYHQRWSLWNEVVAQSRHAQVTAAVRSRFGDDVEIDSSPAGVFFRIASWRRFERKDATVWGPRVTAWCGRGENGAYDIWAGIVFRDINSDREADIRRIAGDLRVGMKAPPNRAQWVRLSLREQISSRDASDQIIEELERLNSKLALLP